MTRLTIKDIEDLEIAISEIPHPQLVREVIPRLIREIKRMKTEFCRLSHSTRNESE